MKWRGLEDKQGSEAGMPLSERLRERRELIAKYVPPETQDAARSVIEEIRASSIHERVLRPGMEAPSFELPDQNHLPVSFTALLKLGRLVVMFFRGRWCPFCIAQLEAMNEVAASIRRLGAELVAISPQTVHQSSLMRDQHRLDFAILSDSENRVARSFGLVYGVPEYQRRIYQRSFTNLPFLNGDSSWELPIPATFILERDGCVLWASANVDYTCRPDPAEILQALQS
jgi:peroxiredoxin